MSHGAGDTGAWEALIEELPVLFASTRATDDGPVVEACNQQFVDTLGYSRDRLVGRPLSEVYTPDSAARLRDGGYARALAGECEGAERTLVRADGTVVETVVHAVPRQSGSDEAAGTYSFYVDVTAREHRRRQAEVLSRLLRHNLRNDLTVVYNQAAAIVERADDAEAVERAARQILDVAARWERLIAKTRRLQNVLSSSGEWSQTDLGSVLEYLEADLNERYPHATVRILRPTDDSAAIRPEVELALVELCENALDHAGDDDPEVVVTVATPADDPWVELTVADDGPVIPEPELLPLRDDETSPLVHGTGLGLWVVRLAVDRVGGEVSVLENDEDGTTIRVRYPR